jgi:hypothetical protein
MHHRTLVLLTCAALGLATAAPPAAAADATAIALGRAPGTPYRPLLQAVDTPSEEDAEEIRRQIRARRGMMNAHQVLSVILLPVAGAAAVMGTINRAVIDQGGPVTPGMLAAHRGLAIGTAGLYTTTGILALAAPHPLRDEVGTSGASTNKDSSRIHRTLALIHAMIFAGLIATGIIDANAPLPAEGYDVLNKLHVVEGWTFFTLLTVSAITISFY